MPDRKTDEKMGKWEATAVCADGRHLLWPPWALFWIPIYFGKLQSFLPRTFSRSLLIQVFDLLYFIHGSWGNFSFHPVLAGWAFFRAMLQEQVAVKYLSQGCFGRYWCAGVQTFDTAEQNSQPLDHVDLACSHNNEVWQLTSCKTSHRNMEDWWKEKMINGLMKDVLAAGWSKRWMDGRIEGWKARRMVGGMDGADDGSLPRI